MIIPFAHHPSFNIANLNDSVYFNYKGAEIVSFVTSVRHALSTFLLAVLALTALGLRLLGNKSRRHIEITIILFATILNDVVFNMIAGENFLPETLKRLSNFNAFIDLFLTNLLILVFGKISAINIFKAYFRINHDKYFKNRQAILIKLIMSIDSRWSNPLILAILAFLAVLLSELFKEKMRLQRIHHNNFGILDFSPYENIKNGFLLTQLIFQLLSCLAILPIVRQERERVRMKQKSRASFVRTFKHMAFDEIVLLAFTASYASALAVAFGSRLDARDFANQAICRLAHLIPMSIYAIITITGMFPLSKRRVKITSSNPTITNITYID
ncbi:unnamed protein product [Caenorhabditis bovis]|uniref:Uncharacterized protein n=1 Tax=Caenorhabditis bovis TaxID=2654633 RepID=A0A8S1EDI1_9PELO|nr:unnamed protein product [Caenorhabditis bovis]